MAYVESKNVSYKTVGIFMTALGALAILFPLATGISLSLLFGFILVLGALAHLSRFLTEKNWESSVLQIVLGLLYAVAGMVFLVNPTFGLTTLTVILFAQLALSGAVEIAWSIRSGVEETPELAVSGVISLVLASIIWIGWPSTAAWVIGVIFGASLVSTGVAMLLYDQN